MFSFIGGFHKFIGESFDLLAKEIFYWRKFEFIGDVHNFIGETEFATSFVNNLAAEHRSTFAVPPITIRK